MVLAAVDASPEVDFWCIDCVLVDGLEFFWCEGEVVEGVEAVVELDCVACADEGGGDAWVAEGPCDSHLCERLVALLCDLVEGADTGEVLFAEELFAEAAVAAVDAGLVGVLVEVLIRQ